MDELYDLQVDPHEMKNLFNLPAHQMTVKQMHTKLRDLLASSDGIN
jgi:hypothetical protein